MLSDASNRECSTLHETSNASNASILPPNLRNTQNLLEVSEVIRVSDCLTRRRANNSFGERSTQRK
jgi:hypothetical protein